jgi:hypothetical protein
MDVSSEMSGRLRGVWMSVPTLARAHATDVQLSLSFA